MSKRLVVMLASVVAYGVAQAADTKQTRFWNLTGETVTHLYLAPAGTEEWGADQCRNDPDGTVDFDERLRITCVIRNIEIKSGSTFSVGKDDMAHCGGNE
jgi:hypothetical protein